MQAGSHPQVVPQGCNVHAVGRGRAREHRTIGPVGSGHGTRFRVRLILQDLRVSKHRGFDRAQGIRLYVVGPQVLRWWHRGDDHLNQRHLACQEGHFASRPFGGWYTPFSFNILSGSRHHRKLCPWGVGGISTDFRFRYTSDSTVRLR